MLLKELGIDEKEFITPEKLISESVDGCNVQSIYINPEKVFQMEVSARIGIKQCLDTMGLLR